MKLLQGAERVIFGFFFLTEGNNQEPWKEIKTLKKHHV